LNLQKINIEQKARDFRNRNALTPSEPFRLKSLLLKLGVLIVFKPLEKSSTISGMALKIAEGDVTKRFIFINSQYTLGRQHFTICHELYHLFIQENFSHQVCSVGVFDKKDKEEYNADCFASYFLLPREGILKMIPQEEKDKKNKITLSTILKIEQYFSSSRSALLIRLEEIGLINKDYAEQFKTNISREALLHGYQTTLYQPGNTNLIIGDYGDKAKRLFDNEKISESHFASLMMDIGIDISDGENINYENLT